MAASGLVAFGREVDGGRFSFLPVCWAFHITPSWCAFRSAVLEKGAGNDVNNF